MDSCGSKEETDTLDDFLSVKIKGVILDNDIENIFYGIPVEDSYINIKDLPLPITFFNGTGKEVNPFVLIVDFHTKCPVNISRYYKKWTEEKVHPDSSETLYHYKIHYDDRFLLPSQNIPFPLTRIKIEDEATTIPMIFVYGTEKDNMKGFKVEFVLYPMKNKERRKYYEFIEKDFLKVVKNMMNWKEPEKTTLVFDTVFVPRLNNYRLLEPDKLNISHLKDLIDNI